MALQQQIIRQGLGSVVDQLVAPLCVLVGEGWLRGELSVYQEHLFTETLQSVLREAIASVDASGQTLQQRPRVLLTTTPSEQHGLGLLMAECHFALESTSRRRFANCRSMCWRSVSAPTPHGAIWSTAFSNSWRSCRQGLRSGWAVRAPQPMCGLCQTGRCSCASPAMCRCKCGPGARVRPPERPGWALLRKGLPAWYQ